MKKLQTNRTEMDFSSEDMRRIAGKEACGNCRYYLQFPEDEDDDDDDDDDDGPVAEDEDEETGPEEELILTGCCRRFPPQPLPHGIREFPAVSDEFDWCGEYIPATIRFEPPLKRIEEK